MQKSFKKIKRQGGNHVMVTGRQLSCLAPPYGQLDWWFTSLQGLTYPGARQPGGQVKLPVGQVDYG